MAIKSVFFENAEYGIDKERQEHDNKQDIVNVCPRVLRPLYCANQAPDPENNRRWWEKLDNSKEQNVQKERSPDHNEWNHCNQ